MMNRVLFPPFLFLCFSLLLTLFLFKSHELKRKTKNKAIWVKKQSSNHEIPQDGFAACLLLKDNNYALSEWLAYHWLTLPLKYLVVAVDPTGTTTPKEILDLWSNSGMGMEITLWNDVDYDHWIDEELDELHKHRSRQKHFLEQCELFHKKRNRKWVAIIDPDEFITYNTVLDDDCDPDIWPDADTFGNINQKYFDVSYRRQMFSIRKSLTKALQDNKTIFEFISENANEEPWASEPCHLMPRLLFSAIESTPHEIDQAGVKQYGLHVSRFNTLRYYRHANRGVFWRNHFAKVIVDLSRIENKEITKFMDNIHTPHERCHYPFKPYEISPLRVNHYIGSWEQYTARADVRRTKGKFNKAALVNEGVDYQLQTWLKKFVEKIGKEKATELLQHAGFLDLGAIPIIETDAYVHVPKPRE